MEENKFDILEEVEQDIVVNNEELKRELKEYEKLLLAEANRKTVEKSLNLIKFGCFTQKQENQVDFNTLESIPMKKKYKGLYQLYRNLDTLELLFICPLIENNKGSEDERKDLKPYGYDVIYLDQMDDETYQMVVKAAKNTMRTTVSVLYKASFVMYFTYAVITLAFFIYNLVVQTGDFATILFSTFYVTASFFVGLVIVTTLLALLSIKYKKYKEQ